MEHILNYSNTHSVRQFESYKRLFRASKQKYASGHPPRLGSSPSPTRLSSSIGGVAEVTRTLPLPTTPHSNTHSQPVRLCPPLARDVAPMEEPAASALRHHQQDAAQHDVHDVHMVDHNGRQVFQTEVSGISG